MAITTDNGKLAIMEMDVDWEPGLPLSPSSFDQAEKQQLLWGFPEVLWQASSVVAGFTASPLSGNAPLAVQFTDTSTGDPTSWLWDFGDGDTSTEENPLHIYQTAGTWTVSLTATNTGGSDELIRVDYITTLSPATNRVVGGGHGGGPILGYQMVEIDFDSEVDRAKFETERLLMKEQSLLLAIKKRRQRDENELLHLDIL